MKISPGSIKVRRTGHCVRRSANGIAMFEVMIALLLFSICSLGLLNLQARAISLTGDTENRNRAALIADQCASQMQLLIGGVTITNGALNLTEVCKNWKIDDPRKGGLPGGDITVATTRPLTVLSGGAALVPVTVDITVSWYSSIQRGPKDPVKSRVATQVTLLVHNS
jgi:type IV pilus assembly protein PilV